MTSDVAVIIPAFRSSGLLDTTLASVAGQSLQPAAVVVADDASGDDTADVARRWADRLPLDVVTLDDNLGPAGARRVAIGRTGTARIALLDADDVWLPDHLETMVATHDRTGGLVTADPIRWVPGAGIAPAGAGRDLPVPDPARQRAAILDHDFVFIGTMFDRADHDAAGGFRDRFRGPEDWDLWIRMIRRGVVVHRAPHPTVLYRLSPTSVSADARMVEHERAVVQTAIEESDDEADRDILGRTLRGIECKAALYASYELARRGRPWAARLRALSAVRGPGRIPARAAAMALAPRASVRARDARVHQPRWWLRV